MRPQCCPRCRPRSPGGTSCRPAGGRHRDAPGPDARRGRRRSRHFRTPCLSNRLEGRPYCEEVGRICVPWGLLRVDPEDCADVVGGRRAAGIGFREEQHGQEPDRAAVSLEVLTVVEVHCRYEVPPGGTGTTVFPVPGTAVLVPVEGAGGWAGVRSGFGGGRSGVRFAGCPVSVDRPFGGTW
ncbi:DUF6578 domain-containing protein [Streptomyces sp. NK15101]|uniref:DUF6578 domain-containing protein n=1 Tax=Streptomyces sp. NK15101 TaxID=2873261 RepID=UPI0035A95E3F